LDPLLSGVAPELELAGGVAVESGVLAGVDESGGVVLGGGVLDCMELSVLGGAAVSEPVEFCLEQAAASVSALRHRINKPRFMGIPRCPDSNKPGGFSHPGLMTITPRGWRCSAFGAAALAALERFYDKRCAAPLRPFMSPRVPVPPDAPIA
jgi:hypothetical protein